MASIKLAGLIIGVILVSLALKYSSACAHEGRNERKGKWLEGIASENHASSQNGLDDDISISAVTDIAGRKGLRGRKMRVEELLKGENDRKQGSDKKSKIAGIYASKKFSKGAAQDFHLKAQDSSKSKISEEQPKQKSTRMGLANSIPSDSYQDARKPFLDAADEVVNLMRRDYGGKLRPRRKPPINNHEPTD